ncbi:AfsR family transcriptional regulator [Pseudonocardia sp. MH-G8]|nr:AfsR family transcriptional regulator [Pseudonocardia sp. MH-G8]
MCGMPGDAVLTQRTQTVPPPQLRVSVLGPVEVAAGAVQLDVGPVLQQAVLAALVLRPDVTLSQRELLNRVWGLDQPSTGVKNVPGYIFRLRRILQSAGVDAKSVIASSRGGYRFASSCAQLDIVEQEEIAGEASDARTAGDLAGVVDARSRALALLRGEPLAGVPGPFAEGERRRLQERRIAFVQDKLDAQIGLGRYDEAIDELSMWSVAYPLSESMAALLVRALYGSGRQADALKVLPDLRARLVENLGVEPGDEVQRAHQAVLRRDDGYLGIASRQEPPAPPRAVAAAPVVPTRRARNELPAGVGSLIGRDRELELLTAPVVARAVTVVAVDGVAGAGKTALAVNAARALRERSPDDCLFVDLHGHSGRVAPLLQQRVLRRLLRTVGVDDNDIPDDLDELAATWRAATASLRLVLVLDDASSSQQVRPLLPSGAGSVVVVTSRRRLVGLDAIRRVSLGPLDLDAAQRLLGRIVGAPRAGRERAAVRDLARLCGRLPLALRIAGARLQTRPMWTIEDLVSRLADDETRLGELAADDRSVEAAFRLSYDQLQCAEQRAFRVLGLAPVPVLDRLALAAMLGCPPGEAERVLESLVDASLLQQVGPGRYRPHDLVAAYARQLAAAEPAEDRKTARVGVLRLYVAAGRCANDGGVASFPTGPEPADVPFRGWEDAAAWLDAAGDLADVVGYAVAVGEVDHACWIAEAVTDHLVRRARFHECWAALETALSRVDEVDDRRMISALRFWLGFSRGMQGNVEQAHAAFTEALRISRHLRDRREEVRALGGLALVEVMAGISPDPLAALTEVNTLVDEIGDDWLAEWTMSCLAFVHGREGRYEEALECLERSRLLGGKIGSQATAGRTLYYSGSVKLDLGRPVEAATDLRQAIELAERVADVTLQASALSRLGAAEQALGNLDAAFELHHRALSMISDQTSVHLELELRNRLGGCHLAAGQHALAAEQFGLVRTLVATTAAGTTGAGARVGPLEIWPGGGPGAEQVITAR